MANHFDTIIKTRQIVINLLKEISIENLNKVPQGFNNNIIWNAGHLIAAQQGICYIRSGLQPVVTEKYFLNYKSGTKPENDVDENEVDDIKETLVTSIQRLETDYNSQIFVDYPAWTTRYGVEIASIDHAIQFLLFHEGLHVGTMMALKRLVIK